MKQQDSWDLARSLGFDVAHDHIRCIRLEPSLIVVETANVDQNGKKYRDPRNPDELAVTRRAFKYESYANERAAKNADAMLLMFEQLEFERVSNTDRTEEG